MTTRVKMAMTIKGGAKKKVKVMWYLTFIK
jgi:hypothetical protein